MFNRAGGTYCARLAGGVYGPFGRPKEAGRRSHHGLHHKWDSVAPVFRLSFLALANVGDSRPRCDEDNERGECGPHFDGLVRCVNADYNETTCAAFHCYRVVLLGGASFKGRHFIIIRV
jgi:hypothetical protein